MRVNLTPLLDKGLKRRTRAAPVTVDLAFEVDDAARRVLVAYYLERGDLPVYGKLFHPQLSDVGGRYFTMHGYEADKGTAQLFGQAWELEPVGRR